MNSKPDNWGAAGPLYDGHLEKRLDQMSPEERLRWLDESAAFLRWAREVRVESGLQDRSSAEHE